MKELKEDIKFEQALSKLEKIVLAMESEETLLEESIVLYKEGIEYSKHCDQILSGIEAEITILQQDLSEKSISENFVSEADSYE